MDKIVLQFIPGNTHSGLQMAANGDLTRIWNNFYKKYKIREIYNWNLIFARLSRVYFLHIEWLTTKVLTQLRLYNLQLPFTSANYFTDC